MAVSQNQKLYSKMFCRCLIPVQVYLGRFQLQGTLTIKQLTWRHIHSFGLHSSCSQLLKIPLQLIDTERDYIRDPERDHIRKPNRECIRDLERVYTRQPERGGTRKPEKTTREPESGDIRKPEKDDTRKPKSTRTRKPEKKDTRKPKKSGTRKEAHQVHIDIKKLEAYMEDSVIGCDKNEVEFVCQKFSPAMAWMTKKSKKLRERIDILCQNGYSVPEIIDCPRVLGMSVRLLSDRLEKMQTISRQEELKEKLPLKVSCHRRFNEYLPRLIARGHLLTDSQKLRKFAEMFQVDENNVMLKRPVNGVSLSVTAEKISTLQKAGFKEKEIMCKSVILSYSNKSIKEAVDYIRQENKELSFDIDHLSNFLQYKSHYRVKNHPEHILKHIVSCLDIDYSSFSKSQKRLIHKASFITVTENMQFLQQSGISKDDIRSCPLILVQEFDLIWKSYLEVGNLENFQHFKENNVKYLNAMQYLIEFELGSKSDDYFDSSVHVDLED